jgi:7-cyano-7-deazaguanine reductase|tara:strand:+ start:13595 stop:14515 length:921 start_codon:yes stop_codon:yes gene_type:complete
MADVKNYQEVVDIASKHLGKVGGDGYKDTYSPELLVKVPRYLNREGYGLTSDSFVGVDTWNCYEVSAITTKGQPVAGMLKIVCPSNSEYHVESKSIKLYLNSFNMTRIADNARDCISGIEARVKRDLDELLETNTTVSFYASEEEGEPLTFINYKDLGDIVDLDKIDFTAFQSDASQLKSYKAKKENLAWPELRLKSNLLRSNCRVTNQPDWGDVYIKIKGENLPTADSLAKYIVSHRTVSHFHEEICEMVYKHLTDAFQPEQLMVACLYTRRGGLDINPVRASHNMLIPAMFEEKEFRLAKTLRQ